MVDAPWFKRPFSGMLAFAAVALAAANPVRANGAFPDEFSVHFPANAPHRILIGSNFGLLVSEDDGNTWRYACEPWVTPTTRSRRRWCSSTR